LIRLEPSPAKDPVNEPVNGDVIFVNCFELDIIRDGTLASDPEGPVSPWGPTGPRGPALFIIIVLAILIFYINI